MPKEIQFNPSEYLIDIKGKKYLPVAARLIWFREVHPDWTIETEIRPDFENKRCMSKATIKDETGRVLSQGHKVEDSVGFPDYVEKSETGAIGRALILCGFGTQFAPELEEGTQRIVDAPTDFGRRVVEEDEELSEVVRDPVVHSMCPLHKFAKLNNVDEEGDSYHKWETKDGEVRICYGLGFGKGK